MIILLAILWCAIYAILAYVVNMNMEHAVMILVNVFLFSILARSLGYKKE